METKDIIYDLRTKSCLSQEELAKKVFVTRQAVSRWETGETMPNTQTLKLLSKLFNTCSSLPKRKSCIEVMHTQSKLLSVDFINGFLPN